MDNLPSANNRAVEERREGMRMNECVGKKIEKSNDRWECSKQKVGRDEKKVKRRKRNVVEGDNLPGNKRGTS